MTGAAKKLLATSLVLGLTGTGAAVFSSLLATANPFGGSDPARCGFNMSCTADDFTADDATGSGFSCSSALAECFDPGPGACNNVGTNVSGQLILGGTDCSPDIVFGDSSRFQSNNWTNTGGAINCDGNCQIRDSANGTLPINTTGGVVLNSTSAMTGMLLVAVTIDIPAITGECDLITATVAGVEANDAVFVTPNFDLVVEVTVTNARVTDAGADEVTFLACDPLAAGADPASGSYLFWVVRKAA